MIVQSCEMKLKHLSLQPVKHIGNNRIITTDLGERNFRSIFLGQEQLTIKCSWNRELPQFQEPILGSGFYNRGSSLEAHFIVN